MAVRPDINILTDLLTSAYGRDYNPDCIVDLSSQGLHGDISDQLQGLKSNVKTLFLNSNRLTEIPDLRDLKNLSNLILTDNNIDTIFGLPRNLSNILVRGNRIKTLDRNCFHEGTIGALQQVFGHSTELTRPPCEVLRTGLKGVQDYFRQTRTLMSHTK